MCWKKLYNLSTPVQRVSINPLSSKWKPVIYCRLEESNLFLYASCPAHSASWLTEGWEAKSCAPSFLSASGKQSSSEAEAVLVLSSLEVPDHIRGSQSLPVPSVLERVFSFHPISDGLPLPLTPCVGPCSHQSCRRYWGWFWCTQLVMIPRGKHHMA